MHCTLQRVGRAMNELILIGASGLAREVIAAHQREYTIVGVVDDNPELHGHVLPGTEGASPLTVLGPVSSATTFSSHLLLCVGAGHTRRILAERLAAMDIAAERYATVVDRSVRVPPSCTLGAGSILLAGVVLTANITIGRHVVVMPHVTLTHDNIVSDYATIAAGVALGGSVQLGEASYVGMNASVRQGVRLGANATLGMGAVLLHDVPDAETWAGVPARRLGDAGRRAAHKATPDVLRSDPGVLSVTSATAHGAKHSDDERDDDLTPAGLA